MTLSEIRSVRRLLWPLLVFGLIANLGMLVSPLFMMQMLDRVVPSGNMATLAMLLLLAVCFIALSALIDAKRVQIARHTANWLEACVMEGAQTDNFADVVTQIATLRHPVRVRSTLSVLDGPWVLVFALTLALLHPIFALILAVSLTLIIAALMWRRRLDASFADQAGAEQKWMKVFDALGADRNRMSLGARVLERVQAASEIRRVQNTQRLGSETRSDGLRQFLRQGTSLALLAAGGALVSQDLLTAGGMIAASLIGTKTVLLAEAAIDAWPEFTETRALLRATKGRDQPINDVPDIKEASIDVIKLTVPKGRTGGFRLQDVSFTVPAGRCLAVLGPSGAGKSTLLDYVSGLYPAPLGQVRIGGQDLVRLSPLVRQNLVGVMPQTPRFTHGTIGEVISCFDPSQNQERVEDAAMLAGVHSTVLGLSGGYATDLAEEGHVLSAGQMQRLALARAVYGQPKVLLLDEPNALQDGLGEQQMADALARIKSTGVTIVMVVHRVGIMWLADDALVLDRGRVVDFGPRGHVLARRSQSNRVLELPVTDGGVQDIEDWISNQFQRSTDAELRYRAILVATELYNFLRGVIAGGVQRRVKMEFAFIDAQSCEITIREEGNDGLNARAAELGRLVASESLAHGELDDVGMSVVMLSRATEDLDILGSEDATEIVAKLGTAHVPHRARAH